MLIPDSTSKVRSLKIPHWIFFVLISLGVLFLALICISRYQASALEKTISKNNELLGQKMELETEKSQLEEEMAQEKNKLENKLEQFGEKADNLQEQLEDLERMKDDLYNNIDSVLHRPGAPSMALLDHTAQQEAASGISWGRLRVQMMADLNNEDAAYIAVEGRLADLSVSLLSTTGEYNYLKGVAQELKPFIDAYPDTWPVPPVNMSEYGVRGNPFGGTSMEFHNAIDIQTDYGASVRATGGGVVEYAGYQGSYGYLVIINHGYGLETYYAHNSKLLVQIGDQVARGEIIALAGSTGRSTGPHVHYEVRLGGVEQNPRNFIEE